MKPATQPTNVAVGNGAKLRRLMRRVPQICHHLREECAGGVIILVAVVMPVLVGFVGVGIDIGMWYLEKRKVQEVVDSGALMGAFERRADPAISSTDLEAAVAMAVDTGGYGSATVMVLNPPTSGPFAADTAAVEVTVTNRHSTYFSHLFGLSSIDIQARAVAAQGGTPADACFLALGNYCTAGDPQAPFFVNGNASLSLDDCSIHANGICPEAVNLGNNAMIEAACITGSTQMSDKTLDNYAGTSNSSGASSGVFSKCGEPQGGMGNVQDPFAHLTPPTPSGSCSSSLNISAQTVSPGYYCLGGGPLNGDYILEPGVYYFEGGVKFHGTVQGDGVVIIIPNTGPNGDIDINAHSTVSLSAPTATQLENNDGGVYSDILAVSANTTDWAGMLVYNQTAGSNSCSKFNGNSDLSFAGAIYMPDACTKFNGGSSINSSSDACFMLVTDEINITGDAATSTKGCAGKYNTFLSAASVALVE